MPAPSAPPLVVAASEPIDQWLKPVGRPGWFKTSGVGLKQDVEFGPLYELARQKYAVYWDVFTPEEWSKRSAAYQAQQQEQRKLEASTIALAQPGEMQSERDFNEQGDGSVPLLWRGHHGRGGKGWFSFDMPVGSTHPVALRVTYGGEGRRKSTFDILIDGKKIGDRAEPARSPEQDAEFLDVAYAIPAEMVAGKNKITVRFQATNGNEIRGVFGIRTLRTDEPR